MSMFSDASLFLAHLLGRRQANLCFHFAGSEENLQEVKKICRTLQSHVMLVWEGSRTASFFKPQVAIFQLRSSHKLQIYEQSVTGWINFNPSTGGHCQRDIKEAPLYKCQRISA